MQTYFKYEGKTTSNIKKIRKNSYRSERIQEILKIFLYAKEK
jgi:hypothetical protein